MTTDWRNDRKGRHLGDIGKISHPEHKKQRLEIVIATKPGMALWKLEASKWPSWLAGGVKALQPITKLRHDVVIRMHANKKKKRIAFVIAQR